ncbi:hypothetical protein [Streptomyces sp. AM6-12]|uniref:hypothetical protein n=1 Tax=Streptomyces sp. AM6-12 TaxID=3345149 RepID=UPI00379365ED
MRFAATNRRKAGIQSGVPTGFGGSFVVPTSPQRRMVRHHRARIRGDPDVLTTTHPDDPGRHLIAISSDVPVLPREAAVRALEGHGFVIEAAADEDASTDHGWSQIAAEWWTAPCQPIA